jgi:hypothetical protein
MDTDHDGVEHAVSELMASVPHRKSLKNLSLGPDESWFGQFSATHPLLSRKG